MGIFKKSILNLPQKVKVTQSCLTLCQSMDYTVHGIIQARILEWVAFPFSRRSPQPRDWTQVSCIASYVAIFTRWATRAQPRDWTQVSCIAGRFFTRWATREALFATELGQLHDWVNHPNPIASSQPSRWLSDWMGSLSEVAWPEIKL